MRTPFQPYGGVSPIIDKMIGNAYDVVKYVARHLKEIRYVAENMHLINDAVHGYRHQMVASANGDSTFYVEIPARIRDSRVTSLSVIAGENNSIYLPGPDTFTVKSDYGQELQIDIHNSNLYYAHFTIIFETQFPSHMPTDDGM